MYAYIYVYMYTYIYIYTQFFFSDVALFQNPFIPFTSCTHSLSCSLAPCLSLCLSRKVYYNGTSDIRTSYVTRTKMSHRQHALTWQPKRWPIQLEEKKENVLFIGTLHRTTHKHTHTHTNTLTHTHTHAHSVACNKLA